MTLIIRFNQSRSKFYKKALGLAGKFDNRSVGERNEVTIPIKEMFEKWEFFNALFFLVIDWQGTTVEYSGMEYHSHRDKTAIFYSLQQSRYGWLNFTRHKLKNSFRVVIGGKTMEEIENEYLTDNQANYLIDLYLDINKNKKQ